MFCSKQLNSTSTVLFTLFVVKFSFFILLHSVICNYVYERFWKVGRGMSLLK